MIVIKYNGNIISVGNFIVNKNTYNTSCEIINNDYVKFSYDGQKVVSRVFSEYIKNDNSTYNSAQDILTEFEANKSSTIAYIEASKIGYSNFGRDIDIPIDQVEVFLPKEKMYNLKGEPIIKSYLTVSGKPVCDLIYIKEYKDILDQYTGITKNEFINAKTIFKFYTKEDKSEFKIKEVKTLPFELTRTEVTDENNNIVDILYSSVKREDVLRGERFKSEEVMKTFNPKLYSLFTQVFGNSWQRYKETGNKVQLVTELNNAPHVEIATGVFLDEKLQEQVTDEDKAVIGLPPEADLTILQLILNSLQ